jgi:hypothetical protein
MGRRALHLLFGMGRPPDCRGPSGSLRASSSTSGNAAKVFRMFQRFLSIHRAVACPREQNTRCRSEAPLPRRADARRRRRHAVDCKTERTPHRSPADRSPCAGSYGHLPSHHRRPTPPAPHHEQPCRTPLSQTGRLRRAAPRPYIAWTGPRPGRSCPDERALPVGFPARVRSDGKKCTCLQRARQPEHGHNTSCALRISKIHASY